MSISRNIKRLREERGLSQLELAKIAGVSPQAVSAWERGLKTPRMPAIQKIVDRFNITKSDLLEDEVEGANIVNPTTAPISEFETIILGMYRMLNEENRMHINKEISRLFQQQMEDIMTLSK